jgi:hypothetical protein
MQDEKSKRRNKILFAAARKEFTDGGSSTVGQIFSRPQTIHDHMRVDSARSSALGGKSL